MKRVAMVLAIFLMPLTGYGATINSIHVNGHDIIRVDGDAVDWNAYDLDKIPLHVAQHTDSASVSCEAMSISDIDNVYFFFDVRDDVVVYGEEMYGNAYWDDSVMVLFPQKRLGLPRQMIWVTGNDTGSIIEYHDNSNYYYPMLWDALGVRASYTVRETGYTVELSIPHSLLEETIEGNALSTLIETGVCDDDDGEDYDSVLMMTGMFWGISSMEFSTFRYELSSPDMSDLMVDNQLNDRQKTIHAILANIADNNLLSAIKKTREIDAPWSLPMRAFFCSKYGYNDESIEAYEALLAQTGDDRVQWWGLFRLMELYRVGNNVEKLAQFYHDNKNCHNWIIAAFATIGDMQNLTSKTNPTITDEMLDYCEKNLNAMVIKDLGIIRDGINYMATNEVKRETSKYYELALSKSTKSWVTSDILHLLIEFYTNMNDHENAERCIEINISVFGDSNAKATGDQFYSIKKYEKALAYYERAFGESPETGIIAKICDCYLQENKLDEAVAFFTSIRNHIRDENANALVTLLFADCLRTNSYYAEALGMYEDVVGEGTLAPVKERAIIGIADIYFNTGEYEKLEHYVEKVKNSNCSASTKYQADIYLNSMLNKM